ncbi:MAG: esterase, partial [Bacteroidetes bacterium]|nr:esterase [Bacteroidota bacterium]
MRREIHSWWSPHLNKQMETAVYGHYGFALLMFPTAAADYLEYERFHLIEAIKPMVESGKCKAFSINSINSESWLNDQMHPRDKALRHQQYNQYICEEVVPFIHNDCSGPVSIITTGASLGAL